MKTNYLIKSYVESVIYNHKQYDQWPDDFKNFCVMLKASVIISNGTRLFDGQKELISLIKSAYDTHANATWGNRKVHTELLNKRHTKLSKTVLSWKNSNNAKKWDIKEII